MKSIVYRTIRNKSRDKVIIGFILSKVLLEVMFEKQLDNIITYDEMKLQSVFYKKYKEQKTVLFNQEYSVEDTRIGA